MSIWAEAYDLPHLADPGKKIAWLPLLDYRWGKHADPFREEGSVTIPVGYERLDEVHHVDPDDHSNDVGSVIHLFKRGVLGSDGKPVPAGSFVVERRPDDLQSEATSTTQLSGRGLTAYFLDRIKLRAFDYPANPTRQSEWNFGAPDNGGLIQRNAGFEDESFPNSGFEEGTATYWTSPHDGVLIVAVEDSGAAQAGDYYGLFNPNGSGSIMRRQVTSVSVGETYTITGWLKDLDGTGERWRLGINGASAATHTNAYQENEDGTWWAELENATEGNGSSDGTYQQTTLSFTAGESPIELIIEYLGTNDHNAAVDSFALSGSEFLIDPWIVGVSTATINIAEVSTEQAHSGDSSLKIQGSQAAYVDRFGGVSYRSIRAEYGDRVSVTPGKMYTASVWVYHTGAGNEDFETWAIRHNPKGPLARTVDGGFLPDPASNWLASNLVSVPPDTWTKLEWTAIADTTQLRLLVAWYGGGTDVGTQNSPTFYVDDFAFYEGLPAINYGELWNTHLLDDRLDWLTATFDGTNDSDGNAWDTEHGFTLGEGDSYGQIAESFQRLWNYVTRIRYDREDNAYYLDAFNPGYEATDHSTTDTGSLLVGMNILGGETISRSPEATNFHVKGEGGVWTEDEDETLTPSWGAGDVFVDTDADTGLNMINILNAHQARNRDQMVTFQASMNGESQFEPFLHFDVFHKVQVNLGGKNPIPTGDRVVTSIVTSGKPGQAPNHQVYVNSDAFASTGAAALAEAVRRLLRRSQRGGVKDLGGPSNLKFGAGGAPTVVVAASDASDLSKSKADFECTGVNDDAFLALAEDICFKAGGGRVLLTEGTFNLDEGIDIRTGVSVEGMQQGGTFLFGIGTTLSRATTGSTDYIISMSGSVGASVSKVRFYDETFQNIDGVAISGAESNRVSDCKFLWCRNGVVASGDSQWIERNTFDQCDVAVRVANAIIAQVRANTIGDAGQGCTAGIQLDADTVPLWLIADNQIDITDGYGIFAECNRATISRNTIVKDATDSTDGIYVDGDRNRVMDNLIVPVGAFRYGINVASGSDNIVVGNDLGDPADYGTDALNDAGTDTRLTYPNDPSFGDNFTIGGSS